MTASSPSKEPTPEFLEWLAQLERAATSPGQHPIDELFAEHHLMRGVLCSMQREAEQLAHNKPIRTDYWSRVVDFVGNFTHRLHRAKEEQVIFPLLVERGFGQDQHVGRLSEEHKSAGELTQGLCDAVGDGDWERVMKVALLYVQHIGEHLSREEVPLLRAARDELAPADVAVLREGCDRVAAGGGPFADRRQLLELVRRVCADTDLDWPLDAG